MPTSVRLDAETESIVGRLARKTGRTKSQVIRDAIRMLAQSDLESGRSRSLYDKIAHLIGCADSGGLKLSERTGEKFRQMLVDRARERRPR